MSECVYYKGETDQMYFQIGLIDPGHFRLIEDLITSSTKGRAKIEVLSLKDLSDVGDTALT